MTTHQRDTLSKHGRQEAVTDYVCDHCGQVEVGTEIRRGIWTPPREWAALGAAGTGERRCLHACSAACAAAIRDQAAA